MCETKTVELSALRTTIESHQQTAIACERLNVGFLLLIASCFLAFGKKPISIVKLALVGVSVARLGSDPPSTLNPPLIIGVSAVFSTHSKVFFTELFRVESLKMNVVFHQCIHPFFCRLGVAKCAYLRLKGTSHRG